MSRRDPAPSFDAEALLGAVSLVRLLPDLPIAALVLDGDLFVRASNPAFERLFGYGPADLHGRPLEDIFEAAIEEAPNHHPGRDRADADHPVERRAKGGRHVEVRIHALPLTGADRPAMLCLYSDVSREHQLERALADSREHHRALWEHLPHGAFRSAPHGEILATNRALVELLGYDSPQELARQLGSGAAYADPADQIRLFERLEAEGGISGHEIDLRRADGSIVHVSLAARAVRDQAGVLQHFEGTITDITERRQASLDRDRLGRILDRSDNEIYLFDAESFRFVQVNRGARNNLGYSLEELASRHPWELQPELDRQAYLDFAERLRQGRQTTLTFETVQERQDGSRYPVEISLQLMAQEEPAVFVALAQDITEQRRLAEQLRLSQRMEAVGVLAGGLAHDFNNLLTAIKGHAELALDRRSSPDWPDEHFRVITHAADRGAELTRQVLAFSRQQVLRPRVVRLNDIATHLEPLLQSTLGEDVRLESRLDPELGWCRVDPGQMEEILINLAINARDSMPSGGSFTLATQNRVLEGFTIEGRVPVDSGSYVVISATDSGRGMDEETRRRAFEPFFTTKGSEGTGLGLAMIYGIVKQSGGYIWLDSEPHRGTTCTICFPRVPPPGREEDPEPISEGPRVRGTETVLLVEDEELVRDLVEESLEREGYRVLTAASAEEALSQHLGNEEIRLLVSDVVLPGMPGTELVRRFAGARPGLRALFVSGYAGQKLQREGLDTLGVPLLEKPFTPRMLRKAVRQALDTEPPRLGE